ADSSRPPRTIHGSRYSRHQVSTHVPQEQPVPLPTLAANTDPPKPALSPQRATARPTSAPADQRCAGMAAALLGS
ncbi:hypothetical protein, partial [Mycobacteroides abscessus]|uniref:hypothetical protein n=1 Tax=Mycobacteroides abscessus TaxID=36809 RepID=UPI001A98A1DC